MKFLIKERFLWIVFSVILAVLIFVLLSQNISYRSQFQQNEELLFARIEGIKDSLTQCEELLKTQPRLSVWQIQRLKKKGLKDPVKDIVADLMKHNELIPYEGVLGGTMGFRSESDIHVLTPKWVLASFDDGHILGHMLLEYKVSNDGKIFWKVVASYLE